MHKDHYHSGKGAMGLLWFAAFLGVGAYLMYKKNWGMGRGLGGWKYRLKGEILDKAEGIRDMTRENFNRLVDETAKNYSALKNIDRNELNNAIQDIKGHWYAIRDQMREGRENYESTAQE